jgi:hypothetical protein
MKEDLRTKLYEPVKEYQRKNKDGANPPEVNYSVFAKALPGTKKFIVKFFGPNGKFSEFDINNELEEFPESCVSLPIPKNDNKYDKFEVLVIGGVKMTDDSFNVLNTVLSFTFNGD